MKNFRLSFLLATLLIFLTVGCAQKDTREPQNNPAPAKPGSTVENQYRDKNIKLAALLPEKEGFTWIYNGFAEYGHKMTLKSIDKKDSNYTYNIDGLVEDISGGEAAKTKDFSLNITYTIEKGSLIQTKRETAMLDSPFDRIELIRTPLLEGTQWEQEVKNRDNKAVTLVCTISEVNNTGGKNIYKVDYKDKNSDYFERREFKEGVGLVLFEKLLVLQDQSFPAGYYLYEEASGYNKDGSKQ